MPGWGKKSDSGNAGNFNLANNTPYRFLSSTDSFGLGESTKRNVVATDVGWVRRQNKTDMHGNARTIDEVLVPIGGLANSTTMGFPDIVEIYTQTPTMVGNTAANLYVVFSEPVYFQGGNSGNNLTLTLANTASGNHAVAICNSNPGTNPPLNANNTLVFRFTPQGGTYQVNAQSISTVGGGKSLRSLNTAKEYANLVLTGAVSNALATFTVSES